MAFSSSIVITGGFGALGSAIGLAAAQAGARVCLLGHGAAPTGATLPANLLNIGGVDLTDTQAANAALQQAAQALGGLADEGINVNAVLPSIIDTPQNRRDMPDADTRHWVRAQDLARVVLFFLGPDSAAVTGAALPVTLGPRAAG